ncbi:MAG: 30S ribosomal protein S7 [Patescibacteria group bacterium]
MRHKKVQKRQLEPDKVYNSKLVAKFINNLMRDGKKTIAQRVFYDSLSLIEKQGKNPLETFERAISNIEPRLEVKARRVGGANYQIPIEVRGERKMSLAIRWIIQAATSRPSKEYHTFAEKLAAELMDAIENKGEAIKKKDVMHRMADANKAFSHFRW